MENNFTLALKRIRTNLDLTQEEFAGTIGVTAGHISSLENGRSGPSYDLMNKIITKHNVDANLFFGRTWQDAKSLSVDMLQHLQNMLTEVSDRVGAYGADVDQLETIIKNSEDNNSIEE